MELGSHMTVEHKAKLSLAHMGQIMSPETRAKLSVSHKGKTTWSKGIPVPESVRAKISASLRGRPKSPETLAKLWKGGPQVSGRKRGAKRRLLGFNPLNSWFVGCEGHHINPRDVIYLPRKLHRSIWHSQYTGQGMAAMNSLAGQFLTEDWT